MKKNRKNRLFNSLIATATLTGILTAGFPRAALSATTLLKVCKESSASDTDAVVYVSHNGNQISVKGGQRDNGKIKKGQVKNRLKNQGLSSSEAESIKNSLPNTKIVNMERCESNTSDSANADNSGSDNSTTNSTGVVVSIEAPEVQTSQLPNSNEYFVVDFDDQNSGTEGFSKSNGTTIYEYSSNLEVKTANQWGGAGGSKFITQESISSVRSYTIKINEDQKYFGFWWSAGDPYNKITFKKDGQEVAVFKTEDLVDFINSSGVDNTDDYYGNPAYSGEQTGHTNEPYSYVNVFFNEQAYDEIVVATLSEGGSAFESDNHTFSALTQYVRGEELPDSIEVEVPDVPEVPDTPVTDAYGIQLRYLDSAFQCGANSTQADIKVNVYDQNNNLLTTMSKGDSYGTNDFDSINELKFDYDIYNLSCITPGTTYTAKGTELLGSNDTVPNVGGYSGQASISQMLEGLNSYEELYLAELGTSNKWSSAYDLQDVVLVVDNDPDPTEITDPEDNSGGTDPEDNSGGTDPEDNSGGDFDKNGIPDSGEAPGDIDGNGIDNYQDPDDDGDGIPDVMELYAISDLDFSNKNDVIYRTNSSSPETTISLPKAPVDDLNRNDALNFDTSTNANYQNTDSDGDNISDADEAGDNDLTTAPVNTDSKPGYSNSDTVPDYLDLDSDGDYISDADEAGDNSLSSSPRNTDKTDNADYLDLDSDNDTISDADEAGDQDLTTDPVNSDSNTSGDTLADFRDLDSDDNGILDETEIQDSNQDIDGDETANFQDLDDDGDNILDVIEIGGGETPLNSDGVVSDGYDYQDTDSDNDYILDENEGSKNSSTGATAVSTTYSGINQTTSHNLQDYSLADTTKDNVSCIDAEGVVNTCAIVVTPVINDDGTLDGTVNIEGTIKGLDYQTKNFAD